MDGIDLGLETGRTSLEMARRSGLEERLAGCDGETVGCSLRRSKCGYANASPSRSRVTDQAMGSSCCRIAASSAAQSTSSSEAMPRVASSRIMRCTSLRCNAMEYLMRMKLTIA